MKNWTLIGRIATFFATAAAAFTVILAIVTYFLLSIASPGAPMEYVAFLIISTIVPYLLVTVFALIVAVMSRGASAPEGPVEESPHTPEEEALPPAKAAEENA